MSTRNIFADKVHTYVRLDFHDDHYSKELIRPFSSLSRIFSFPLKFFALYYFFAECSKK